MQKRFATSFNSPIFHALHEILALPENRAQGMGPGPQFELAHNSHTAVRAGFMLATKPSIFNFSFNKSGKNIKHGVGNWIKCLLHIIPLHKNILIYKIQF